jgi:hypothetical protein
MIFYLFDLVLVDGGVLEMQLIALKNEDEFAFDSTSMYIPS